MIEFLNILYFEFLFRNIKVKNGSTNHMFFLELNCQDTIPPRVICSLERSDEIFMKNS